MNQHICPKCDSMAEILQKPPMRGSKSFRYRGYSVIKYQCDECKYCWETLSYHNELHEDLGENPEVTNSDDAIAYPWKEHNPCCGTKFDPYVKWKF